MTQITQIQEIKNLIKDVTNQQTLLKSHQDTIRQNIKDKVEEAKTLGVEPKDFKKLVSMYAKDEREKAEDEFTEVIDLYDQIFKGGQ